MSGLIRTGTSVQKSVAIPNAGAGLTWQHNRGVNALAVRCYLASTGAVEPLTVTQPDANSIKVVHAGGATCHLMVDWDVPSLVKNSIQGAHGTTPASNGFV